MRDQAPQSEKEARPAAPESAPAPAPAAPSITPALAQSVEVHSYGAGGAASPPGDAVQLKEDATVGARPLLHGRESAEEIAASGTASGGGPLPHFSRIQKAFGQHDISGVQAHTGGAAASASQSLGAQAYAYGDHVAFKGAPDLHTAAHEAAHVVQQRGGVQLKGGVGTRGDAYEQHADAVADAVVAGGSAEGLLDTMAGSGGSTVSRKAVQLSEDAVCSAESEASESEEEAERDPTPEEEAALAETTENVDSGSAEGEAIASSMPADSELQQEIPEDAASEGGASDLLADGESGAGADQAGAGGGGGGGGGGGAGGAQDFTPAGGGTGGAPASPSVTQYMNEHGPQENAESGAAAELAGSAWGIVSSGLGPIVGYDAGRGGFQASNILGVGKAWDGIQKAATQDRGEDGIGTALTVVDTLRAVAEAVGSISSSIGTACLVASLVGLFPPLAPVGAALLTVAGICKKVSVVSNILAAIFSLVVSVLSAIRVVRAVQNKSADLAEAYAQYQTDVAGLVSNGISVGMDLITARLGKGKPKKDLAGGMKQHGAANTLADGRSARGAAYQGLKSVNPATPGNLLSTKGTTREALNQQLRTSLRNEIGKEIAGKVYSTDSYVEKLSKKAVESTADQDAAAIRARNQGGQGSQAAAQSIAPPASGQAQSTADRLQSTLSGASEPGAEPPAPPPPPLHSPQELDQIRAAREEIAGAREHVSAQREEGEAGVAGGEALQCAADEHEQTASGVDQDQVSLDRAVTAHEGEAATGREESDKGSQELGTAGQEAGGLQSDAEGAQGETQGTQMPTPTKEKGFWNRVANFFKEKIFAKVSKAFNWVRDQIGKLILKVVAWCMGVDNIEEELAKVRGDMETSEQESAGTRQAAAQVDQDATTAHQDAATASADAQTAITEGNQSIQEADQSEQSLSQQDAALAQQEQEIGAYCSEYEDEHADYFTPSEGEGPTPIDPQMLTGVEGEASSAATTIDGWETDARQATSRATAAIVQDAGAAGYDRGEAQTVWAAPLDADLSDYVARQDTRRGDLSRLAAQAGALSGQPADTAEARLNDIAIEIGSIVSQAESDHQGYLRHLRSALGTVAAELGTNQSVSTPDQTPNSTGGMSMAPDGGMSLPPDGQ